MGQIKWYKRDPDAALSGMMELNLEERGAYNTVLDLIYARDGNLPDDDRFIAGWCRVDVRVWRRIKGRLVDSGKLRVVDGKLHNSRADAEVVAALGRVGSASEAGLASGRARSAKSDGEKPKNNNLGGTGVPTDDGTGVRTNHNHNQNLSSGEDKAGERPPDRPPFDLAKVMFDEALAVLTRSGIVAKQARSVIGRWRKDFSDAHILEAVHECVNAKKPPVEPVSWITQNLHHGAEKRGNRNSSRTGDEPTDPFVAAAVEREADRAAGRR